VKEQAGSLNPGAGIQRSSTLFRRQWNELTNHPAFRRAPALILLRIATWSIRCLLHIGATISLSKWDVRLYLPPQWRGVTKHIYILREDYEPDLAYVRASLSSGQVFVDVGACYGLYTIVAGTRVERSGCVLAFEPMAGSFAVLQRNIRLNALGNVLPFRVALSDRAATSYLNHDAPGCDWLGPQGARAVAEQAATIPLDTILEENGIGRVDMIKIDVEGSEELVLRGAVRTLTTARPVIIFEVTDWNAPRVGLAKKGAWDVLETLGYQFFTVTEQGDLHRVEWPPFDKPVGNVVAVATPRP
jgi:FkbM family methyltransferase